MSQYFDSQLSSKAQIVKYKHSSTSSFMAIAL